MVSFIGLSGTLFLDASVGEFGRLRGDHDSDNSSSPESEVSRSESEAAKSEGDVRFSRNNRRLPSEEPVSKACRSLASAYSIGLAAGGKSDCNHLPVPERYLKSLLRRFPYGKQWNFDPYGNTSSDEFSDSSATTDILRDDADSVAAPHHRRNRNRRRTDGQILCDLFPGARSLALMPMYDAGRERFFAGAIVWSYDPLRVLTVQDDLNYLGAFCDVIMAEVGRLDAQNEANTKASFISSMSHELRTPLVSPV